MFLVYDVCRLYDTSRNKHRNPAIVFGFKKNLYEVCIPADYEDQPPDAY